MKVMDLTVIVLLKPILAYTAPKVLQGRLSASEIKRAIRNALHNYKALVKDIPPEETLGARVMVRLATATVCLYQSLQDSGLTGEEAIDKISQVNWLIYKRLTGPPWKLTGLLDRNPLARVRRAMDLFMRFPYAPPGYRMNYVEAGEDTVAFDVHRCPAADYFARHELHKLCLSAFCNLDYPLADVWKATLERTQTLAQGAAYCDFRSRPRKTSKEAGCPGE